MAYQNDNDNNFEIFGQKEHHSKYSHMGTSKKRLDELSGIYEKSFKIKKCFHVKNEISEKC